MNEACPAQTPSEKPNQAYSSLSLHRVHCCSTHTQLCYLLSLRSAQLNTDWWSLTGLVSSKFTILTAHWQSYSESVGQVLGSSGISSIKTTQATQAHQASRLQPGLRYQALLAPSQLDPPRTSKDPQNHLDQLHQRSQR